MLDRIMRALRQAPTAFLAKILRPDEDSLRPKPGVADEAQLLLRIDKLKARLSSGTGGMQFLPLSENFTEETEQMRAAYRVMLREPMVKAALYTKIFAVAALDIQVQPGGDRPIDKDAADFVKWSLQKSRKGTRGLVTDILTGGLIEGYSVGEKKYKIARESRWAGKYTLEAVRPKDPEYIQLIGDDYRNITAVRDRRTQVDYDPSLFVIFQHLSLYDNVTGMSDFRAAYRAYWVKNTAWQLRSVALERFSLPVMKGTYETVDDRPALEEALKQVRSQSWLALPQSAQVEAMDIAARGTSDFQAAIADLNEEIVTGIAGATLQMLQGQVADGRGSSETHKGVTELLQWYLAAEVGDIITGQLVPDLVELNFLEAAHPTVTFGGVNDSSMTGSLQIDSGLLQMGLALSKSELYLKYGRQEPTEEDDKLLPPNAQQGPQGGPPGGPGGYPPNGGGGPGGGFFSDGRTGLEEFGEDDDTPGPDAHGHIDLFAWTPFKTARGTVGAKDGDKKLYGKAAHKVLNATKKEAPKVDAPKAGPKTSQEVNATIRERLGVENEFTPDLDEVKVKGYTPARMVKMAIETPNARMNAGAHMAGVLTDGRFMSVATPKELMLMQAKLAKDGVHESVGANMAATMKNYLETKPQQAAKVVGVRDGGLGPRYLVEAGGEKLTADANYIEAIEKRHPKAELSVGKVKGGSGNTLLWHENGKTVAVLMPMALKDATLAPSFKISEVSGGEPQKTETVSIRGGKEFRVYGGQAGEDRRAVLSVVKSGDGFSIANPMPGAAKSKKVAENLPKEKALSLAEDLVAHAYGHDEKTGELVFKGKGEVETKQEDKDALPPSPQPESKSFQSPMDAHRYGYEAYKEWAAGLSKDEYKAVGRYINDTYRPINNGLRESGGVPPKGYEDAVANIDKALSRAVVPENLTVYRGVGVGVGGNLKVGSTFTDPGYTSTSLAKDAAENYGQEVVMEINVPKGARGAYAQTLFKNPDSPGREQEFLLPRGSSFKIASISDEGGVKRVKADLVQTTSPKAGDKAALPPVEKKGASNAAWSRKLKSIDQRLWDRAIKESLARGDDFNHTQFTSKNPKRLSPADRDLMNQYIFGTEKGVPEDKLAEKFDDESPTSLPDIRQDHPYDCGAATTKAVADYFGLPGRPLDWYRGILGTDEDGTRPAAIANFLRGNNLHIIDGPKSLEGLRSLANLGYVTICPIQKSDHAETLQDGHYVAVTKVDDAVHFHDPVDGPTSMPADQFDKLWHDKDADGNLYVRYGIAVGEGNGKPEDFDDEQPVTVAPGSTPQGDGQKDVAGSIKDAHKVQQLLNAAEREGTAVLADVARSALERHVAEGTLATATTLLNPEETKSLADAAAKTLATAELLGRARVIKSAEKIKALGEAVLSKFADDPDEPVFTTFADIAPLRPEIAVDYFRNLVPTLGVEPERFGQAMERDAFTMARVTSATLLERIKGIIGDTLETGVGAGGGARDLIRETLTRAGVTPWSPQYAEMVFRTNAMDAFNTGADKARLDPDIAGLFPVWQYMGIADGRQRMTDADGNHNAHFGKFFANTVPFAAVRDSIRVSPWNCRCVSRPISRFTWQKMQAAGARMEDFSAGLPVSSFAERVASREECCFADGENCGTGDGGFKKGNSCGGESEGTSMNRSELIDWDFDMSGPKKNDLEYMAPDLIESVNDWVGEKEIHQTMTEGDYPKVWLHGTKSEKLSGDFVFDKGKHDFGHGVYLTDDPGYAAMYSKSPNELASATIGDLADIGVHPVVARLTNPFIPEARPLSEWDEFAASVGESGFSNYGYKSSAQAMDDIVATIRRNTEAFTRWAKIKGHDGVVTEWHETGSGSEGSGQMVAVCFSPSDAKPLEHFN